VKNIVILHSFPPFHLQSSFHKDIVERLITVSPSLANRAKAVLLENKQERHIRGGLATKMKYAKGK